jgi:hypothetical protein
MSSRLSRPRLGGSIDAVTRGDPGGSCGPGDAGEVTCDSVTGTVCSTNASSNTFQLVRPGRQATPSSKVVGFSTVIAPPHRRNSSATTASSSIGLNEHVE